ncbi:MAG TPA: hypothetical protein P5307_04395, partial [Pirellulaceae bacterium]|nr:hypothetical protein [Pirellulaceae bacterium]
DAFACGTYDDSMTDHGIIRRAKAVSSPVPVLAPALILCAGRNERFGPRRLVTAFQFCGVATCQALPTVQNKSGSAANNSCDMSQHSKKVSRDVLLAGQGG